MSEYGGFCTQDTLVQWGVWAVPGAWCSTHTVWVALSAPKPVRKTDGEAKRINGVSPSSSLTLAKLAKHEKNTHCTWPKQKACKWGVWGADWRNEKKLRFEHVMSFIDCPAAFEELGYPGTG